MTAQTNDKAKPSRRAFLKGAGVAGVAAALTAVPEGEAEASETGAKDNAGYRETDHINAYYEAAKF